jgi:glycosyltransferase involved in cell wall biosynthesis
MMTQVLFWSCAAFVLYAYLGYPSILYALSRVQGRPVRRAAITPRVSMIITVRNEEARIARKLSQSLAFDYPPDRFELIVASDCSTDATHSIVESHRARGVKLVVAAERRGKEFAQKLAIEASSGEILVFSDVATAMDANGLRHLVSNFADPGVGCVSSVDRLLGADGQVSGEGLYVRYEMFLRSLESSVSSVVGLSGSLFAARRAVCEDWAIDIPSDFTTLLNSLRRGLRGISDTATVGYYPDLSDSSREYARKVRTITRGMAGLLRNLELLNPLRYGLPGWQLLSHKVCRWLVPFALIGLFVSNLGLAASSPFYFLTAVAQAATYGTAAIARHRAQSLPLVPRTLTFFVLSNASILHAWFNIVRGRQFVTWEPSKRPDLVRQ